jgi:hypothetical protein
VILSRIYQDKFDQLKQKFGCNDVELEALLRESNKSVHTSIESLIDQKLSDIDTPRRRKIYAVDWTANEPVHRWERKPKKYNDGRLSSREIKEIFDNIHHTDVRFSSPHSSKKRLLNLKKFVLKNKIAKLRQRPAQSLNRALRSLGKQGRRELIREGKRVVRNSARRKIRGLVSRYF